MPEDQHKILARSGVRAGGLQLEADQEVDLKVGRVDDSAEY